MKQGMLFCLTVSVLAWQLAMASETDSPYRQAQREYEAVVSTYLQGGICAFGKIIEVQQSLATTVAKLSSMDGEKALLFAVTANSLDDVQRLLAAGAPRVGDNGSLLHAAVLFGGAPVMEALVSAGLGLEDHRGAGGSPLFAAVQANRPVNVEWLVRHGADVNAVDTSGAPVLRHALVCGSRNVIQILFTGGARVDEKTRTLAEKKGIDLR